MANCKEFRLSELSVLHCTSYSREIVYIFACRLLKVDCFEDPQIYVNEHLLGVCDGTRGDHITWNWIKKPSII
jgi:hypothetical protein